MNPGETTSGRPAQGSPPDWYRDPWRRYEYRYHNGSTWTADVSMSGNRFVDPLGSGPSTTPDAASPTGPASSGWTGGPPQPKRDGLATAAMVLGIVGLTISWAPVLFVAGAVCAVLGLVFGVVALRRRKAENRSFALTGALTGGAGILMVGIGIWTTTLLLDTVDDFENPPPYRVEITRCGFGDASIVVEGTIENLGDRTSGYRVVVRIAGDVAPADRDAVFEVDDVDPDEVATFEGRSPTALGADLDGEPTCRVDRVTGPLPFGLDIEPGD